MIWNIIIEPLEERYSIQWRKWFGQFYLENKIDYTTIEGKPLTNKIERGAFLDVFSTNHYKASQLMEISRLFKEEKIQSKDVFFFHDLWFPGLEMLAYIRDAIGLDIKIGGCLHAGTYDPYDFLTQSGMKRWGQYLEQSWWEIVDFIFVATEFHKQLLLKTYGGIGDKITVTGFPIKDCREKILQKEDIVVFPHRLHMEKQPELFDMLNREMALDGISFLKTKDVCKNKSEYYTLLCRAKISVSFALQETWGIAMQEALFCGCLPLNPNRLSYPELYPRTFIFSSLDELKRKIAFFLDNYSDIWIRIGEPAKQELLRRGQEAIPNMIQVILE